MVYVPSAKAHGFDLRLNEDVMREILNSSAVEAVLHREAESAHEQIVQHVTAAAEPRNAANYVAALFVTDSTSAAQGMDFSGAYSLGDRPVSMVELVGDGPDPDAKYPLMVEADHHSLSSPEGFTVGGFREDVR